MTAIRYPDDAIDRLWATDTTGPTIRTSEAVNVKGIYDSPPISVMQTSTVTTSTGASFYYNLTHGLGSGSYKYHMAFFFSELDPRVNASGLRVFDIWTNSDIFYTGLDIYFDTYRYGTDVVYTPNPWGPYSDYILIRMTSTLSSVYPPIIAAAEILQLFDNPMLPATSSVDSKLLFGQ